MSKKIYFTRYNLIIKKLKESKIASFKEISDYLKNSPEAADLDLEISSRTFQRDLKEILDNFDIEIKFNKKENGYYISEEFSSLKNGHKLLETLEILNGISIAGNLSPYIYLEQRKPLGIEYMHGLLYAIQNTIIIECVYTKFWEGIPSFRSLEPFALKEFKGRWYLIAKDRKDETVKTFGLDRITDFIITNKSFKKTNVVNVYEMFRHTFGITSPDNSIPEEIILSFSVEQGKYIKSYPLHSSQEIISETEFEIKVKLYLYITHELIMELLSYGFEVAVEKPVSLRKEIISISKNVLKMYESF